MSNEREIRLTGVFKDDITPKLQRLNEQIAATVRQFERLQKRLRPIAKEMGVLAMASERVGNSLRAQRTGFESNIRAMRAYRSEMGRTVAAQRRLMGRTALPQITAAPRVRPPGGTRGGFAGGGGGGGGSAYVHPRQRMSRGGVASTYAPSAQRMPSGGGGGVGIADGAAGAAFGITLGNQIGSIMTNAVMTGFHKGVELMQKPFKFLAHEFRHAMQEEMADITAAGAMFALDKAGKTGMFKDFEDARMAQEMLDQRLALSAGRLPGETLQYVQQARQLQDTIMQAMGRDKEGFIKHAEKLGAVPGDMRDAFATVLAQFTERAVLLGMGGGGTGGLGVPQLLEQMVGQEAVRVQSMGMRYSALRTNPLLKAALERNEAAINATTVGTIERINAIQKALDEALPQEVITAMTMTMNGIAEGFRSSIFDIAAGWFGVRRMMKGVEAATYKMSGEIKQATNSTLSLFDVLRDTIGFFVVPLLELTSILPEIYEPFEGLVNTLVPLRAIGARFTFTFNQFAADYEAFAKEAFPDDFDKQTAFLKNRGPRAALRSIAALLEDFDPGFSADEVSRELLKVDADFGKVAKDMITSLLDSGFMEMVGETMGNFVSELLTVMANLVTGATDFATTSRFAKGFSKGLQGRLDEAGKKLGMGAFEAIRKIFEGVFRVMGRLLLTIVTQLPMETMLFVGITAVLPAALAALGTKIGMTLSAVLGKAGGMIQASLMGTKTVAAASGAGATTTSAVTGGTAHAALTGKVAPLAKAAPTQTFGTKALTSLSSAWAQFTAGIKPLFQGIKGAFQGLIKGIKALVAMLQMGDFRSVLTMILSPLKSLGGALKAFSGGGMAGLKALSAMLQMGDFKSVMQMLISPLKIFSQGFKGFGQLLSNGAKGLGKFGGAITAIVAAFNIFSGLLSGKDIWESLGQAAGPVIGTLIGTALLGPIGGVIGGFIGSLEPVTSFFEGVFVGLGDALGPIGESLAEIGHTLWLNLSEMWGVVTNIIPGLKGLGGEFDALRVGITTIKILLFPLTATLDLINVALQGLRIGFLYLQKWIAGIPGIGRLAGDQAEIQQKINDAQTKFAKTWADNERKYSWDEFTGANIASARAARQASTSLQDLSQSAHQAGSSFENNKKYVDDAGKQWGWAMLNGQRTIVEWGSVAGTALRDVADSASQAAGDLTEYQQKTRELIAQGKASGLTPTATDMAWYNEQMAKTRATTGIYGTAPVTAPASAPSPAQVAASPIPAIQALSTKQAEANAMLAQINAKILPQQQVNPIPQLQTISTGLSGASALIAQVKAQIATSGKEVKAQIATSGKEVKAQVGASSNNMQTKIEGTTAAVNSLSNKFTAVMPVRIVGTPTVKFDIGGGMGPIGGGIGGFPKTSGYGMRWGKMHQGNDYAMPVGTKLGIGGPGKVLGAGYWGGYGNAMDVGGPGGMVYRFAHLSKFLAPVGANLPPGMPFALSGNTGRSTGPHLHFEARPGGLGPVNPDAYAGIIRANFAGTALGPLMGAMGTEMKNMPYGAQLAVANSDEIFMKPKQMAHVIESSARAGAEGTGNITTGPITINVDGYDKDPRELTEIIASQLVTAMYKQSRSEVLTS